MICEQVDAVDIVRRSPQYVPAYAKAPAGEGGLWRARTADPYSVKVML